MSLAWKLFTVSKYTNLAKVTHENGNDHTNIFNNKTNQMKEANKAKVVNAKAIQANSLSMSKGCKQLWGKLWSQMGGGGINK